MDPADAGELWRVEEKKRLRLEQLDIFWSYRSLESFRHSTTRRVGLLAAEAAPIIRGAHG